MLKKYIRIMIGLFLCAAGMVITINADLGYSPWDVFHQGLGNIFNIKIGSANIIVGIIIVLLGVFKGQKPGIGTILNMFSIGMFMNLIMGLGFIPKFSNIYIRLLTIPIGMLVIGLGTYLYIEAGLGTGPRDGLMVLLLEKTNKSVSFIRNSIEITVLIIGYLLGGPVGLGTVIVSFGLGFAIEFVFNLFEFNPKELDHRGWDDEINSIKSFISRG